MPRVQILLSPRAERDLADIAAYTLKRWGVRQMEAYMAGLDATIQLIAEHPARGTDRGHLKPGLRGVLHETHYHILYRVKGNALQIVRVLHTRMDIAAEIMGAGQRQP